MLFFLMKCCHCEARSDVIDVFDRRYVGDEGYGFGC